MPTNGPRKLEDLAKGKGLENYNKAISNEQDLVMVVLEQHLLTETLLEQLVLAGLPRGDRILDEGSLTYSQKLTLTAAMELLSDPIISSLRKLNKVRNECAHQLDKVITENDIARVGSPLGPRFTKTRHENLLDNLRILKSTLAYVIGYLNGALRAHEMKAVQKLHAPVKKGTRQGRRRTRGNPSTSPHE